MSQGLLCLCFTEEILLCDWNLLLLFILREALCKLEDLVMSIPAHLLNSVELISFLMITPHSRLDVLCWLFHHLLFPEAILLLSFDLFLPCLLDLQLALSPFLLAFCQFLVPFLLHFSFPFLMFSLYLSFFALSFLFHLTLLFLSLPYGFFLL